MSLTEIAKQYIYEKDASKIIELTKQFREESFNLYVDEINAMLSITSEDSNLFDTIYSKLRAVTTYYNTKENARIIDSLWNAYNNAIMNTFDIEDEELEVDNKGIAASFFQQLII